MALLTKVDLTATNLLGRTFGKLTVVEISSGKKKATYWKCRCDCGGEKIVYRKNLLNGTVRSCGCLVQENLRSRFKGVGEIPFGYWTRVLKRVPKYIGVPITIEEAWKLFLAQNRKCALSGVELTFHAHKHDGIPQTASLDRIDSTKGYVNGNVQWIHKDLNSMKRNYSDAVFIDWCIKVAKHNFTD
jgi:hypothetical protein